MIPDTASDYARRFLSISELVKEACEHLKTGNPDLALHKMNKAKKVAEAGHKGAENQAKKAPV